jgi:hypothetical protein
MSRTLVSSLVLLAAVAASSAAKGDGVIRGCFASCGDCGPCDPAGCCDTGCCDPGCDDTACCDPGCSDAGCGCAGGCGGGWGLLGGGGDDRLFGIIAPSDTAFSGFVSPMTNFVYFEDPRTLSELRFLFVDHDIPTDNALAGGGVRVYAMQFRIALSERLSVIGVKDGWIEMSPKAVVAADQGWANVTAGLKYNVVRDVRNQFLLSAGFTYEMPTGHRRVLQGFGDGDFNIFLTSGWEFAPRTHLLASTGFRLPASSTTGSQMWHLSGHLDHEVVDNIFGFVEMNLFHYLSDGDGSNLGIPDLPFEGHDAFNLGSGGAASSNGSDVVTLGVRHEGDSV